MNAHVAHDLFSFSNTSQEALESIDKAKLQAMVLKAYRTFGDMTADECAERLRINPGSIRPRVTELKKEFSLLRDTGARRRNESGRSASVLTLTEAGR